MSDFSFGSFWCILLLLPVLLAAENASAFKLLSSVFEPGQAIPTPYANRGVRGGRNISPPLAWDHPPAGTKSFALACIDRHPVAKNWVHWLVINIPEDVRLLAEGASGTDKMPAGAKELNNTFGPAGWGGPQPPAGSGAHPYEFILYALNVKSLDLRTNTKLEAFNQAIAGKVLGETKLVGTFQR